jgi:membrane protein DedA with SNARE-associated domain
MTVEPTKDSPAMERAKLQRYRVGTVIGSAAWVLVAVLAGYLAVTLIGGIRLNFAQQYSCHRGCDQ